VAAHNYIKKWLSLVEGNGLCCLIEELENESGFGFASHIHDFEEKKK